MEVNQLVAHYKANYERKVFMTRLSHAMQNAYLMYIYDYPSELKNFADTFLAYLIRMEKQMENPHILALHI